MQDDGLALTGRGEAFNAAIAKLYPFATNVDAVLAVLERDSGATRTLLADGAQVLDGDRELPGPASGSDPQRQRGVRDDRRRGMPRSRRRSGRCRRS